MSNKSDRELLELAAKAAGMMDELDLVGGLLLYKNSHSDSAYRSVWDPLEDDGEALRLAVKLELDVFGSGNNRYAESDIGAIMEEGEPYAANRRAIVRAAAEIGKQLQG